MCGDGHPTAKGVVAEPVRVRRLTNTEGQRPQSTRLRHFPAVLDRRSTGFYSCGVAASSEKFASDHGRPGNLLTCCDVPPVLRIPTVSLDFPLLWARVGHESRCVYTV
jgi:hypothetical protein